MCSIREVPRKGGWTFAQLEGIKNNPKTPFGWQKVNGSIDGYEIKKYHLMPMGNGNLFLPVKAAIRKQIKKQVGNTVQIVLYLDTTALVVPEEMLLCLEDEPQALHFFNTLSESNRKYYIDWIYSAKQEKTKINRLAKTINRLCKGQKLYDPEQIF